MLDKHARLVEAAKDILHRQGFAAMTIAAVAEAADVPAGNVFYYFRKKRDLGDAVVKARMDEATQWVTRLDSAPEPRDRLVAFVMNFARNAETYAAQGCQFANLVHEVDRDPELRVASREVFRHLLRWLERQMRLLGCDRPRDRAVGLLSAIQGACLLAKTLGDAALLRRSMTNLVRTLPTSEGRATSSRANRAPTKARR